MEMANRDSVVRLLSVVVAVLFVFLIAIEIQVQQLQSSNDRLNSVVTDTKNLVDGAVNNPANAQQQAGTARALQQIDAIEYRLCGGPCPPPPGG